MSSQAQHSPFGHWIPADDNLPPKQELWDGESFVAVLFEDNEYPMWVGRVQIMTAVYLHNYIEAEIVMQSSGKITHWMPIPKPSYAVLGGQKNG